MGASSQAQIDNKEAKLWGGRFEESVTDTVEKFTESISFDKELYKHDIMGSKAHATMLAQQVCFFFFLGKIPFVCLVAGKMWETSEENGNIFKLIMGSTVDFF